MVTRTNFDWMRRNNFGIRVMTRPITIEIISAELQRYDAMEAGMVSSQVRAVAGLSQAVDQIVCVYQAVLNQWVEHGPTDSAADARALSTYLQGLGDDLATVKLERNDLLVQSAQLQAELDNIHKSNFWKFYMKIGRIAWIRKIFLGMVSPGRR
jgi:hypothetical protein